LDTVSGQRLETAFRGHGLQLAAWVAGELQVATVVGSVRGLDCFDPFMPIAPPPAPESDGRLRHEWLLAESLRFRVDPAGSALLGPLAKRVDLTLPPYPNAAFDFYYHAPGKRRSIFVFGARNEYQDDYARAESCRYEARAVTSDGICLAKLGVGMIWSEDGRYLVVTTRVPVSRGHPDYEDLVWKARLVDCEQRLIYPEVDLGGMPIFEGFAGERVDFRRVDADWWREDVDTVPAHLDMAALMQGRPAPLVQRECLWLADDGDWHPRWREAHTRAFGLAVAAHHTR
ncbi:MAG TPA: hypothetical protein VFF03_16340, partial [Rhodocyclaceae bacterium]|nr:hypothetical protein [Rhodocyclaceae bacterium]